jgi:SAM-dependent methyltransferase
VGGVQVRAHATDTVVRPLTRTDQLSGYPAIGSPYPCAACGAQLPSSPSLRGSDRLLGTPGVFEVLECTRCGAGLTLPRVSVAELEAFYTGSYAPYAVAAGRVQRTISALLQRVQGWRALRTAPLAALRKLLPGRALDVGCGRGDLGARLIARGWRVTGIDPSQAACAAARARGLDARAGTLDVVELEPGSFDAATLQHSLEHVPEPVEDLRRVHAGLRDGGLLVVIVPNFGSWQRKAFRTRWFHLDLPRHRVHFTRDGLDHTLKRAGFEALDIGTSTSSVGLPGSLQYALFGRCVFPGGLSQRIAVGACIVLLPFIRLADWLLGEGDVLHAVARKART